MPATVQQAPIDQVDALEPNVIEATVRISRTDVPNEYHHHVNALTAAGPAGSKWIVQWTLEASDCLSVQFKNDGIKLPAQSSMPDGIHEIKFLPPFSDKQRRLAFTNKVSDVNVIRYDFDLDVLDLKTKSHLKHNMIFDPTIAVVREPLG